MSMHRFATVLAAAALAVAATPVAAVAAPVNADGAISTDTSTVTVIEVLNFASGPSDTESVNFGCAAS